MENQIDEPERFIMKNQVDELKEGEVQPLLEKAYKKQVQIDKILDMLKVNQIVDPFQSKTKLQWLTWNRFYQEVNKDDSKNPPHSFRFYDIPNSRVEQKVVKNKHTKRFEIAQWWMFNVIALQDWETNGIVSGKPLILHVPFKSFQEQFDSYLQYKMQKNFKWIMDTNPTLDILLKRQVGKAVILKIIETKEE